MLQPPTKAGSCDTKIVSKNGSLLCPNNHQRSKYAISLWQIFGAEINCSQEASQNAQMLTLSLYYAFGAIYPSDSKLLNGQALQL